MIIDFHTHIFPPDVRDNRDAYVARDPTFAEMYNSPKAVIATAEDLLASMDDANIDISVTLGFAWGGQDDIVRHNDYLLEAAARANGHLLPFTTINMAHARAETEIARCAAGGALGLGELRPDNQGWNPNGDAGDRLAAAAREHNLVLLFHVTEEGGHQYPGKQGCALASFRDFARKHAGLKIVGAHLGGGIYLDQDLPDVFVDTAAVPFLHKTSEQPASVCAAPPDRLLFGSDFPLVTQERSLRELRGVLGDGWALSMALGGNARSVLQI